MRDRLADLEFWITASAVLTSMVYVPALPWVAGVCLAAFVVRALLRRRVTIRTPADGGVLLLLVMAGISLWVTALPAVTQPQVSRLLSGIALCYAIVNWGRTQTRVRWLFFGLCLAGFGLAVTAPLTVAWATKLPFVPAELYERFTILVADTIHPNVMAGVLVILAPLPLALLLYGAEDHPGLSRIFGCLCFTSMAAALVLTQSRGAWLAFCTMLVVMITLRWRWGWLSLPIGAGLAGVLVQYLGLTRLLDAIAASNTLGGVALREEFWSRAIYMIQDFAFTGVGMGTFGHVADLLYPFFLVAPGRANHAHNLFLQVAVDLGIPGLVGWLAVLLAVIAAGWRVYHNGRMTANSFVTATGAAALASIVALVVHGMLDAVVWGMVRPAPLVWAIWGVVLAAANLVRVKRTA
jgi:putative inorganic carbon (hco3(-)) transporter